MKPPFQKNRSRPEVTAGFTLIELLTVIAIIALLAAAVVPALNAMSGSGRVRQNLINVSGALEKAREYAVSHNTYTWVTWKTSGTSATNPIVQMAFASGDGSQAGVPESGNYGGGYGGTNRVIAIDRPTKLESCRILGASSLPGDSPILARVDSLAGTDASGPGFSNYQTPMSGTISFDKSVMFTPAGEARVSSALPENIQLVVMPLKGDEIEDKAGASLIRISGLTGRVRVYRP